MGKTVGKILWWFPQWSLGKDISEMMVVGFQMGKTVLQVLQVGKDSAFQVDKGLGKILLFMLIQRLPRLFGHGNGWFSLVCF